MAKTATLTETFNGGSVDSSKWTTVDGHGTMSQTNGQLVINVAASQNPYTYDEYRSVNTYDLTGSSAIIHVPGFTNNFQGAEQKFVLELNSTNMIAFVHDGTFYNLTLITGGAGADTYIDPYPADSRWWRIRESGGTIYWDSSTNGYTWVNHKSASVTFSITALTYVISAGTWQSIANPGSAKFDNLNILSEANVAWFVAGAV